MRFDGEPWCLESGAACILPWFSGRLWGTEGEGDLHVLQGAGPGCPRTAHFTGVRVGAQRLDASPDGCMLLIAGAVWAAQFDGQNWQWLIREMPLTRAVADGPFQNGACRAAHVA